VERLAEPFPICAMDFLVLIGLVQCRAISEITVFRARFCIFDTHLTIVGQHYYNSNHSFNFFPTDNSDQAWNTILAK
jgi:hypothetical protein